MLSILHFASRRSWLVLLGVASFLVFLAPLRAATFQAGESVRLTRGEMLLFKGKNHAGGAKGQEFSVLKHDPRDGTVYVAWYNEDGSVLAVTVPADALEVSPPDAWSDLLRGVSAFREQRFDEARRILLAVARDPKHGALASALAMRIGGAINASTAAATGAAAGQQALAATVQALRDAAVQLTKLGHLTLALWLDEGTDRMSAPFPGMPATKLDRKDLAPRVAAAQLALHRGRQAVALHRLTEASRVLKDGLQAEPGRADLEALQSRIAKDLTYAEESYEAANRMRRFDKGAIHALTAIERGLKACADHPQLRELKKEMQSAFVERTSPPVTPEFLSTVKASGSKAALTDGHKLYTTRCTECHDLEMVDSRTMEGWQRTVGGMSRRAGLSAAEQSRILEYLSAAKVFVEKTGDL